MTKNLLFVPPSNGGSPAKVAASRATTLAWTVLARVLWSDLPAVRLFAGTGAEILLRRAAALEVIDDPECGDTFETCQAGIYFRASVTAGAVVVDYRWLYLCKNDDLQSVLEDRLSRAGYGDAEAAGVGVDAVFQSTKWREARARSEARAAAAARAENRKTSAL